MHRFLARSVPLVAVAAAAVAVSGTTGAVAGRMISGKQIQNHSITKQDIKPSGLDGSVIKNGSVHLEDLAHGTVPALAAYQTYVDDDISLTKNLTTVASLYLPRAGTYVVSADVTLTSSLDRRSLITCDLMASPSDQLGYTVVEGEDSNRAKDVQPLATEMVVTTNAARTATWSCVAGTTQTADGATADPVAFARRIVAVQVA